MVEFSFRITPAHAGKTTSLLPPFSASEDHPRLRGKDLGGFLGLAILQGSPPLTRERLWAGINRCNISRITPAYAGNTLHYHQDFFAHRDHPRLRGKDKLSDNYNFVELGSPLLTRERQNFFINSCHDLRITPAYAGKTLILLYTICQFEDHPRLRGKD